MSVRLLYYDVYDMSVSTLTRFCFAQANTVVFLFCFLLAGFKGQQRSGGDRHENPSEGGS